MTQTGISLIHRICGDIRFTSNCTCEYKTLESIFLGSRETRHPDLTESRWLPWASVELARFIYSRYFLGQRRAFSAIRASARVVVPIPLREDSELGKALRAAHMGTGYYDDGWHIIERDTNYVLVEKNGLRLKARANELVPTCGDSCGPPTFAVHFPKDRPYLTPGYYVAVLGAGPPRNTAPQARIYLNVPPDAAITLLRGVSTLAAQLAWSMSMKLLNNPESYSRPDTAIIYVERDSFSESFSILHRVLFANIRFRPSVPGFTRRWRSGVAFADELPRVAAPAQSFGQHRSLLIARAVARAQLVGATRTEDIYEAVTEEFRSQQLDPARPYLGPGAADIYSMLQTSELGWPT